jgi:hypothetical protein
LGGEPALRIPHLRYSVSGAMGVIFFIAVGLAALRNANELWVGTLSLLTLGLVGVAVLGMIHGRGARRAWWLGFFLFTVGYLTLVFGPWFSEQVGTNLATTQVLNHVHMRVISSPLPRSLKYRPLLDRRDVAVARLSRVMKIARSPNDPAIRSAQNQLAALDKEIASVQGFPLPRPVAGTGVGTAGPVPAPTNRWQSLVPGAANYDQFIQVGHYLFAVIAGFGGAATSARFFARRGNSIAPGSGTSEG